MTGKFEAVSGDDADQEKRRKETFSHRLRQKRCASSDVTASLAYRSVSEGGLYERLRVLPCQPTRQEPLLRTCGAKWRSQKSRGAPSNPVFARTTPQPRSSQRGQPKVPAEIFIRTPRVGCEKVCTVACVCAKVSPRRANALFPRCFVPELF